VFLSLDGLHYETFNWVPMQYDEIDSHRENRLRAGHITTQRNQCNAEFSNEALLSR